LSHTANAVKEELDKSGMQAYMYRRPIKLRKRKEVDENAEGRTVEPNLDATGMELHKDSKYKLIAYF